MESIITTPLLDLAAFLVLSCLVLSGSLAAGAVFLFVLVPYAIDRFRCSQWCTTTHSSVCGGLWYTDGYLAHPSVDIYSFGVMVRMIISQMDEGTHARTLSSPHDMMYFDSGVRSGITMLRVLSFSCSFSSTPMVLH